MSITAPTRSNTTEKKKTAQYLNTSILKKPLPNNLIATPPKSAAARDMK
jgi:hypothetical protein